MGMGTLVEMGSIDSAAPNWSVLWALWLRLVVPVDSEHGNIEF